MSCPNATSPINITKNTDSKCDLKCEYSFKYPTTNLQVANRGGYLAFRTDPSPDPPVVYNANKYDVKEFRLYGPSLHTYGGKHAQCELIIVHNNLNGSGNLLVCIPLTVSEASSTVSLFDNIINQVAVIANSAGEQTTLNLPTFSLNNIVPKKPYYSYTGTLPYSPCNGNYSYIVFDKQYAIKISIRSLVKLSKIISAQTYDTHEVKGGLYYNESGPKIYKNTIGDDIYIECKPTGSEGEVIISNQTPLFGDILTNEMLNKTLSSKVIGVLIGVALMLGLIKLAHILISKLSSKSASLQTGGAISSALLPVSSLKAISKLRKK